MDFTAYDAEVLRVLSRNEWKTAEEIIHVMYMNRVRDGRQRYTRMLVGFISKSFAEAITAPSLGGVYVSLARLEELCQAEHRLRDKPALRSGGRLALRPREWRLTEEGLLSKNVAVMYTHTPTPATAPVSASA